MDKVHKPVTRRTVIAGAAAAVNAALIPVVAMASAPRSFEDELELIIREAEARGYTFCAHFWHEELTAIVTGIVGATGGPVAFNDSVSADRFRVADHLIATGCHNRGMNGMVP